MQDQFEFIDVNPEHKINLNYTRHVGYDDTNDVLQNKLYNTSVVSTISRKLTQLLRGVNKDNRPIIVSDENIINIMDSIYRNYRPLTGDIYTRYIIPNGQNSDDYTQSIIDQTIQVIYAQVKTDLEMEQQNAELSVWTTVLGTFNDNGLRSHDVIYTKEKRPQPMMFNMNY